MVKKQKLILFLFLAFLSAPWNTTPVFAEESKIENELKLVGETYSNSTLVRQYTDQNNQDIIHIFDVPEHLRKYVESSDNQILEAKKHLHAFYTLSEDKEMLEALTNTSLPDISGNLTVDDSYKKTFESDSVLVTYFSEAEMSKEGAKTKYLVDYGEANNGVFVPLEEDESKVLENNQPFPFKHIGVACIIFLLFGVVFIIFKRR